MLRELVTLELIDDVVKFFANLVVLLAKKLIKQGRQSLFFQELLEYRFGRTVGAIHHILVYDGLELHKLIFGKHSDNLLVRDVFQIIRLVTVCLLFGLVCLLFEKFFM